MIDFITRFMGKYKANCEMGNELDRLLMQNVSFEEWKDIPRKRYRKVRRIYKQNEILMKEMEEFMSEPLNSGKAWELYYGLWDLYFGGYDDLYMMRVILQPLLEYYDEKRDYEKLVFLNYLFGFENYSFYQRMLGGNEISEAIDHFQTVLDMRDYYDNIMDIKTRKCYFQAYYNLIRLYVHIGEKTAAMVFQLYKEAIEFWNSDIVQELDKDVAEIREVIDQIREEILYTEEYASEMTPMQQEQFKSIIQEVRIVLKKDKEGNLFRALLRCRLLDGENPRVLIKDLILHIKGLSEPDYNNQEQAYVYLFDVHSSAVRVFDYFEKGNVSPEDQAKYIDIFFDDVTKAHTRIPSGVKKNMVDNLCVEWYKTVAPHINSLKYKIALLKELIIGRQPMTYIHSIMVSEISKRITKAMLKNHPEYFSGMPGYERVVEDQEEKEQLVDYVEKAAFLHDIGKCELVEVINRQDRKLTNIEFTLLRKHPEKSVEFVNNDAEFEPFYDVMLGHHISYDSKNGYPKSFDKHKSKVEPIIDIIMIADCTDAATDVFGRYYAQGKDFDTLFKELQDGAGSWYNPDVVSLIEEDRELYEDLKHLTGEGRNDILYRVHYEIVRYTETS